MPGFPGSILGLYPGEIGEGSVPRKSMETELEGRIRERAQSFFQEITSHFF